MSSILLLTILLVVLLTLGMPVSFALGLSAITVIHFYGLTSATNVSQIMFSSLDSFVLVALPFFILAGVIMSRGNLAKQLFAFLETLFSFIPGGLAAATIATCVVFAAISGSSLANAAVIGMLAVPMLGKQGYPEEFSTALVGSGGTLGILIPPSITMILFGSITDESVGKLFAAGLLPGVVIGIALCILSIIISKVKGYGKKSKKLNLTELRRRFYVAAPILIMPIIVLGGIYAGILTPTEAGVVACIYGLFFALFIFRTIKVTAIIDVFAEAAQTSGMIFFIVMGAMLFSFIVTMEQVPQAFLEMALKYDLSWPILMIFLNVLLLVLGCFLDVVSCMLITVPIVFPLFTSLGVDPCHLAVVYTINMEIATVTPPIGMNLFVLSSVSGVRIEKIVKGMVPFYVLLILALILTTYVPIISTWLPSIIK